MIRNGVWLVLGSCLVFGCAPAKITQPPITPTLTSYGESLGFSGYESVEIRTFENVGKNRVWLEDAIGVQCQLQGKAYSVNFTTPAKVNLPVGALGSVPEGQLKCTFDGETLKRPVGCNFTLRGNPNVCSYADVSLIFKR